ncbi:MAG: hypothetical protein ACE5QW_01360 [Thermoplasmata archaeon]
MVFLEIGNYSEDETASDPENKPEVSQEAEQPSWVPPSARDLENVESKETDTESKSTDDDRISEIVAKILSFKTKTFTAENVHFALAAVMGCNYKLEEVEKAMDVLATPPLSILEKDNGKYSFTTDRKTIMSSIKLLEKAMENVDEAFKGLAETKEWESTEPRHDPIKEKTW